jgi:hypothetical protein
MTCREGLVVRLLGLALLLLAVSPLTAPFSTCDPLDLFGGGATVPVSTSMQAKTVADEPAVDVGSPIGMDPALLPGGAVQLHDASSIASLPPLDIPLRL